MFSETSHVAALHYNSSFLAEEIRLFFVKTHLSFAVMAIKKHSPAKESSWLWTGS